MKAASSKLTRTGDAYARLRAEIRNSQMPPGHVATEPELALRLGMSRTPVREALLRLEAEGLVELVPRRGFRVLPLRAEDMREIYGILTSLEPDAAAAVATGNPTDKQLAPLEQSTSEMEAALGDGDLDRWAAADDHFHQTLLELHGNKRLTAFVTALYDQAHRARLITLRLRELPVKSTQEHREILEYLRAGDAEATRATFRRHRERSASELLRILQEYRLPQL